ncbi:hypothetical protein [Chondromyces crocatus]|uniref:Uncharacterized protein n=1 Tax=Chondromyces crocatus TaxID=52 RepID=A0A0K1ERX8_CHOCO|nr:hypothetical protein [Chondromyces crocatus]AKT43412.1 uncharacterized protein CMC5_076440 [Chondromyces crocatus]
MTSKTLLSLAVGGALCFGAGCKGETATTDDLPKPVETAPETPTAEAAPATDDEIAKYPNQVPQSGTRKTLQAFKIFQAADPASKLLTTLGPGTLINLKASSGNWMLVDWPCGVSKLCPGWTELSVTDSRVSTVTSTLTDAGTGDAGTTPTDAGTTPTDAGTTDPADAGTTSPTDAGAADPADAGTTGDAGRRRPIKLNIPDLKK